MAGYQKGYGKARIPLTCGEFVQGNLDGVDFLVSCPIGLFSQAEVWLSDSEISVWPPDAESPVRLPDFEGASGAGPEIHILAPLPSGGGTKAMRALELALRALEWDGRLAWLKISRPLPPGKGFGSSTADIAAAAFAAARALGRRITPGQVARIALSIEPTDGTMFPGLALFDHRKGSIGHVIGSPPPMRALILDFGGEVDTGNFNRRAELDTLNARKEPEVRGALRKVMLGIRRRDPWLLGEGATQSAIAHQPILPKEGLEEIAAAVRRLGACGVVAAHSGTVVGILLPFDEAVQSRVEEHLSSLRHIKPAGLTTLVGGGEVPEIGRWWTRGGPADRPDAEARANEG